MEKKRNCINCKSGLFGRCDGLKNNEEYQSIWENRDTNTMDRMVKAHDFKSNFVCDEFRSLYIEYPIEVSKINTNNDRSSYRSSEVGKFVRITPCAEKYERKTYLGLYLGELPMGHSISHNTETKELNVSFSTNPAIFVFDLNEIIYGMESWWGIIETEDDLKEITDIDIENIWYVKALKSLADN